jgi:hypothetical protein
VRSTLQIASASKPLFRPNLPPAAALLSLALALSLFRGGRGGLGCGRDGPPTRDETAPGKKRTKQKRPFCFGNAFWKRFNAFVCWTSRLLVLTKLQSENRPFFTNTKTGSGQTCREMLRKWRAFFCFCVTYRAQTSAQNGRCAPRVRCICP